MFNFIIKKAINEHNLIRIDKLDTKNKKYLKKHIEKSILEKQPNCNSKYIPAMVDDAIEYALDDELLAFNYIETINYTIDDEYNVPICQDHLNQHSYFTYYATNSNF